MKDFMYCKNNKHIKKMYVYKGKLYCPICDKDKINKIGGWLKFKANIFKGIAKRIWFGADCCITMWMGLKTWFIVPTICFGINEKYYELVISILCFQFSLCWRKK